ncbi:MAG: hypothetical protein ABI592_06665 [Acidobacteriota bacterium]
MTKRLESWKEIAAHFGRRVRTVQRWEKEEGLPVHRHAHRLRGTVHALPEELDRWWASRTVSPAGDSDELAGEVSRADAPLAPRAGAAGSGTAARPSVSRARVLLASLAAGLAGVAIAASMLTRWLAASPAAAAPDDAASPRVLEARYLIHRGSAGEVERALALCSSEIARIEADPRAGRAEKAAAHECVAHGALARARMGRGSLPDGLLRATAEAETAHALDPRRADAVAIAAWAGYIREWNAPASEAAYRRAIALDPSAGLAHHGLAHLLSSRGRHDESIAELRRAQRAQPLSAALNDDGCWFFYRARRYAEGITEAERALTLEPQRPGALQCILNARSARGEHPAARDAAVTILRTLGDPAAESIAAAPAEEALRRFDRRMLERLEERRGSIALPSAPYAFLYAELGDRDRALAWLERGLTDHDPVLLVVRVHPAFDSLRGDPRLEPLLRRAGV